MKTKSSTEYYDLIKSNLEEIRKEIENIKSENNIEHDVVILAATKTVPAEYINYATQELGIRDIGENRVQELLSKYDDLIKENVNIHFIGSLQTNKVKYIIDKVCLIHSLDSVKLAAEIDRQAKKHNKVMDVLVEINIGEEENKSGVMPCDFESFLDEISGFKNIRVRGVMSMAPVCTQKSEYSKYFEKTYRIFIDILLKKIHNVYKPILSMGMSDSYSVAIKHKSNMVRIGTAIFGNRVKK